MSRINGKPCTQCEALMINGTYCHETGCPIAWQDYPPQCGWCGCRYEPEEEHQQFCCENCAEAYCS